MSVKIDWSGTKWSKPPFLHQEKRKEKKEVRRKKKVSNYEIGMKKRVRGKRDKGSEMMKERKKGKTEIEGYKKK